MFMVQVNDSFFIVSGFPDLNDKNFNKVYFAELFKEKNSIINAKSSAIEYEKHWGSLSIKFAWNGKEHYHTHNTSYSVDSDNFLILNQDTFYSSSIFSDKIVESFSISFSPKFVSECLSSKLNTPEFNLDFSFSKLYHNESLLFAERTYNLNADINTIISKMYNLCQQTFLQIEIIDELFYDLFSLMLSLNNEVCRKVDAIPKVKASTRFEIFKRLEYSRDFIEYAYSSPIDLHQIAGIACMNTEYFIRQFKAFYGCSPIQYLIRKRLIEAKKLLFSMDISVQEVCRKVGYEDPSSFGKLFRKYFQVNPKSYQKYELDISSNL